jgi:hypothetical protein
MANHRRPPLILLPESDNIAIDLGAEKLIIAQKGLEKIAVEIKSFTRPSIFYEFHQALGQYFNYETALIESREERTLYLAISGLVYDRLMESHVISKSLERIQMKLLVVNIEKEEIIRWEK